jgi:hypothetical protein
MDARITRRKLVALAAAAPAAAQQPVTPPPIPSTPEEERQSILAQLRSNADALAKVPLPMSTEPAIHFKA